MYGRSSVKQGVEAGAKEQTIFVGAGAKEQTIFVGAGAVAGAHIFNLRGAGVVAG